MNDTIISSVSGSILNGDLAEGLCLCLLTKISIITTK